ncbi:hypothetical protein ACPA9J_00050 [Pseudomonas aeruginosa]
MPPAPLPHVSRGALKRIKHPQPIPIGCPHCGGLVRLVSNRVIYGREYGDWPACLRLRWHGLRRYVACIPTPTSHWERWLTSPCATLATAASGHSNASGATS